MGASDKIAIAAILITVATAHAQEPSAGQLLTSCEAMLRDMRTTPEGRVTVSRDRLQCWHFMSAVQDLIRIGPTGGGDTYLPVCPPANSTLTQHIRIFVRFAQQNPKDLNSSAGLIAMRALRDAYPCRGH